MALRRVLQISLAVMGVSAKDYGDMSASEKQDYLWEKIVADTKGDSFMNPLQTIATVENPKNLWAMTNIRDDWREASHHKATHGVGAHAKAHFEWKRNNYSGMFQGASNCIIRMANAAPPGGIAMTAYGPNLAVKCLRDGAESGNMEFIWQVDGYAVIPKGAKKSCSYFETPLSNHNPLRDDIDMALKDSFIDAFQGIDQHSMFLGTTIFGSGKQEGNAGDIKSPQLNSPWALVLKPASGLNMVRCDFGKPISQLLNLEEAGLGVPGKTLYEVYAVRHPSTSWKSPSQPELIGSLVLDSAFTPSTFGDRQLFFRHKFWADEIDTIFENRQTDPELARWNNYADTDNYKHEGANIYWPLLPGGQEEIDRLANRTLSGELDHQLAMETMLQSDLTLV